MGGDESIARNVFNAGVLGLVTGGLVGMISRAWVTPYSPAQRRRFVPRIGVNSIVGQAALFALVGVAFSFTEGVTASILDHKGAVATALGGTAAGSVLGLAAKSPSLGATSALIITGAMIFADYNGASLSQQGERNFNKIFNYNRETKASE